MPVDFAETAAIDVSQTCDALNGAQHYLARCEIPAAVVALHDATVAIALTLGLLRRMTAANAARLLRRSPPAFGGFPQ